MSDDSETNEKDDTPKAPSKVWVVEDNETLRKTVARVLGRQKDMECAHQFERCEDAIEALVAGERPDVMLFDIGLPGAGASGYLLKTSSMGEIPDAIREVATGGAPINSQIARRVLDMFSDMAPQGKDYGLTEREKEVLDEMVKGLTKKEIADQLDLSFHTVDKHIRGIYSKLHVNTMTGAVAKALKEGLLPKG